MKRQIVVIGLGRFGSQIARTLYQLGHDVMAIDVNEPRVQAMMGSVTFAIRGDATQESMLRELGVPGFDIAIVAIGQNVEASIMVSVLLRTLSPERLMIVARAHTELHKHTLERIGCNRVVSPESEMGTRLAHLLLSPDVEEYLELSPSYGVSRLAVPDRLVNLTLREAGFAGARDKYGVAVVALKRGDEITLSPDIDERMRKGDVLVVAGKDELVERLSS